MTVKQSAQSGPEEYQNMFNNQQTNRILLPFTIPSLPRNILIIFLAGKKILSLAQLKNCNHFKLKFHFKVVHFDYKNGSFSNSDCMYNVGLLLNSQAVKRILHPLCVSMSPEWIEKSLKGKSEILDTTLNLFLNKCSATKHLCSSVIQSKDTQTLYFSQFYWAPEC